MDFRHQITPLVDTWLLEHQSSIAWIDEAAGAFKLSTNVCHDSWDCVLESILNEFSHRFISSGNDNVLLIRLKCYRDVALIVCMADTQFGRCCGASFGSFLDGFDED